MLVVHQSKFCVCLASANRDEARFDSPDTIKLDRSSSRGGLHVAFGYGSHACLGLHLARAEVRIALQTLLSRMHDIRLAPRDPVSRVESWLLRGPSRLELR